MDIRMRGWTGSGDTPDLEAVPEVRVLILTTFELDEYIYGAACASGSCSRQRPVRAQCARFA